MKKAFISSVIGGFEEFRAAAKSAVELMDLKPVMAEEFASRAYSSETACISEVQKSDLVILVLGTRYGFLTSEGISVTRSEYRAALKAKKPILVFLQDGEFEPDQLAFKAEVEKYDDGFFRTMFSTPEQLEKAIVKAIRNWESEQQAVDTDGFGKRLEQILPEARGSRNEARAFVAFWGQPVADLDLEEIESQTDSLFEQICRTGAASLRDGYEVESKPNVVVIRPKSQKAEFSFFSDGLMLLSFEAEPSKGDSHLTFYFVSPHKVTAVAKKALMLNKAKIVWALVGLSGMESRYFDEPAKGNSSSVPMFNQPSEFFTKLFSPITQGSYEEWIDAQVKKLKRTYQKK